jgi:hypothetical protein
MTSSHFEFDRNLHFVLNGVAVVGKVRIGGFEYDPSEGLWRCYYSVEHVAPEIGKFRGHDPLDAFIRCYRFIDQFLRGCEDDGLVVWWMVQGDHGGFLAE